VARYLYIGKAEDGRYWFVWGDGLYFTYVTHVGGRRVQRTELFIKLSKLSRDVFIRLPRRVREFLEGLGYFKRFKVVIDEKMVKLLNYVKNCTLIFHTVLKHMSSGIFNVIAWKVASRCGEIISGLRELMRNGDEWIRKYNLEDLLGYRSSSLGIGSGVVFIPPKEADNVVKRLSNAMYDPAVLLVEQEISTMFEKLGI